ncbi:MAG: HD domain-containing protein, partial [Spirochaetaceae bacterium]|nr:HD domain-containing protein [Spirochaetaceae bacterium]
MRLHPLLKEIGALFGEAGHQAFLVGGAVRDLLRGKAAKDWDIATDARPEEVMRIFRSRRFPVIPTGIKHGTVTVLYKGNSVEVTTFRTESDYADGRHPEKLEFAGTIEEDLSRRDFTINAIAISLSASRLITDPYGGEADIRAGVIRCVGEAAERFGEDGLRPLRALRFSAQLGFSIEEKTLAAIPGALGVTAKVSAERIRDELDKIILSERPSRAFLPMLQTGMMQLILPELAACDGIEQKGYHRFDVLQHSLLACDYAAQKGFSFEVRMSALLHDIGKPDCRALTPPPAPPAGGGENKADGEYYTFYRHEEKSAKMTDALMRRLRYPNALRENVAHLVACHMFHYTDDWGDAAVRRFVQRVGAENLDALYQLRLCDTYGMAAVEPAPESLLPLMRRVEAVLEKGRALSIKDLAINGRDLMALGIPAGKQIGIVLGQLLEAVMEDPEQNNREKLLEIANNVSPAITGGV